MYNNIDELERTGDAYTYFALMVVIYSSFINYPVVSFRTIIQLQQLDNFVKYTQLLNQIKFFSSYQTKSVIIGLCSLLKNEQIVKEVPNLLPNYLNLLLILLNKQKQEESKKLKQALKNEVSCNFIDSDDEEDEESEEENIGAKLLDNFNKKLHKLGDKFNMDDYDDYSNEVLNF